jgi:hypothetical protein
MTSAKYDDDAARLRSGWLSGIATAASMASGRVAEESRGRSRSMMFRIWRTMSFTWISLGCLRRACDSLPCLWIMRCVAAHPRRGRIRTCLEQDVSYATNRPRLGASRIPTVARRRLEQLGTVLLDPQDQEMVSVPAGRKSVRKVFDRDRLAWIEHHRR